MREYEQIGAGSEGRERTIPWGPDKEQELQNKYLQAKLQELEKEIASMKDGPFGRESPYLRSLPVDARNEILKQIEEDSGFNKDDEAFSDDEIEAMLENDQSMDSPVVIQTPAVTLRIPRQQKTYVKHFNQAIEQVEFQQSEEAQIKLLKWYLRCQQHVSGFSNIISEDVWHILWNSQVKRVNRPRYLVTIAQDMVTTDFKMTSSMWISYIRALRSSGDTASALAAWNECKGAVRGDDEDVAELFTLGVILYSDLGQPQKAEDLIAECSNLNSKQRLPLYKSLITAWAKSNDRQATQHAWAAYLALKQLSHKEMRTEQFTEISTALLQAGKRDMALAVFKDLISSLGTEKDDSVSIFARLLHSTSDANTEMVSAAHIDDTALKALSAVPRQFNNKYFYGAWIKQLIGVGEVDGAADVAELMHERGIKLDAKHLNGIVGAWFRNGTKSAQLKAENFAWAMVHARIELARKQDYQSDIAALQSPGNDSTAAVTDLMPEFTKITTPIESSHVVAVQKRPVPHFLRRSAPAATIETFSILLRHYTIRSDLASAEYLTKLMEEPAHMQPNSYIMNHWLYALLRQGEVDQVWARYIALTKRHPESEHLRIIKPDLETFAALWDAAKVAYNPSRTTAGKRGAFPNARLLFSDFTQWFTSLPSKDQNFTSADFSILIYDVVVRCYCLQSDFPGLLCAIWYFKQTFNAAPSIDAAQIICLSVAKQLTRESRAQHHGRTRGSGTGRRTMWIEQERRYLVKLGELLEGLEEMTRIDHAVKLNMSLDEVQRDGFTLNEEQENGVRVEALKDFLIDVIRRFPDDGDAERSVSQRVQDAALEMGVDVSDMPMAGVSPESGVGLPLL